ncbi:hypothetical protein Vretifemale_19573 [Volvox reticuliferus]|uniref:Uncharacterized protein n=1 Tax=Volvox reticuliferus TaxID=1737510 RepID=A0A8J4FVJ0_9CHLO|nr:hypothetical protein Vretifemale_19573 [Volvox reticuliferus]
MLILTRSHTPGFRLDSRRPKCSGRADQPPAVLKFHFPASVAMLPCTVAPPPSHADLQIMANGCLGDYQGKLTQQGAADMLSGGQQRASKAISHLYSSHPKSSPQTGERKRYWQT